MFNYEIFNQTNLDQIPHEAYNREILNQSNLNQIYHKSFNREISNQTNLIKYLIKLSTMRYLIRRTKTKLFEIYHKFSIVRYLNILNQM